MRRAEIRIGTSGWRYARWVGPFYPEGTPVERFLPYYMGRLDTVESNNTFYQLRDGYARRLAGHDPAPLPLCLQGQPLHHPHEETEGSRAKHRPVHRRDRDPEAQAGTDSLPAAPPLGGRSGAPRHLSPGPPGGHRYAFESWDESWSHSRVYELLADHDAAFCIYDLAGRRAPAEVTTDFAYVRLHGPGGACQGSYDGRTLDGWARRFLNWRDRGTSVYCYCDNDEKGYAALDALRLIEMIRRRDAE